VLNVRNLFSSRIAGLGCLAATSVAAQLSHPVLLRTAADAAPPALERTEIVDFALLQPDCAVTFQVVDPAGELAPDLDD
jgi:hypothetical protein